MSPFQDRHTRDLPADEAIELVRLEKIPLDYRIHQARDGMEMKDAPNLIFDYAADDPAAIAEVRTRHGLE